MSEKKTQYCGQANQLGEDLLIDLNINQLREILANADNNQFKRTFTTRDGQTQETIKLKAVKLKERKEFQTHFLCLNDYVKGEAKKETSPF